MKSIVILAALFASMSVRAQWTVVYLNPPGTTASYANGVHGSRQVGNARVSSGIHHAGIWNGSAGTWIDLHPAGFLTSSAGSASQDQQAGFAEVGGNEHAGLWSGTAASWVDLHPAGAARSWASDVEAGVQAGTAMFAGGARASLWQGTSSSIQDLHPAGAAQSGLNGMGSGQQVGYTIVGGLPRAGLWTGTAASWVDLHPSEATQSIANECHNGQQVGYCQRPGSGYEACMWTGTAASWINLHPPNAAESSANAVAFGQQVGWINIDTPRACLWNGNPNSWIDLHAFLQSFENSSALGITRDGAFTYVVGNGYSIANSRWEALLWISRSVAPTSFGLFRGAVVSGNLASLLESDDNRLILRPGPVFASTEPPVQVILEGTATTASPNGFSISIESSASFGNAQQKISLYNFSTGLYEELDTRLARISDNTVTLNVTINTSRFIQAGTLAVRARVSYKALGPSFAYPWTGRIDKVWWSFPG